MKEIDPLVYWIWLTQLTGIGPVTQRGLLKRFYDPITVYEAREEELSTCKGIGIYRLSFVVTSKDLTEACKIYDECCRKNIKLLVLHDPNYPLKWKNKSQIPILFYYKGYLSAKFGRNDLSIVSMKGNQRYHQEFKSSILKACDRIIAEEQFYLGKLQKGTDTLIQSILANKGCYSGIFLANSVDVFSSKEYQKLQEAVCKNGIVLSMYPPNTKLRFRSLPKIEELVRVMSDVEFIDEARYNGDEE